MSLYIECPLLFNDFLLTRMMEIVVHSGDLAECRASPLPPQVFEPVLDLLSRRWFDTDNRPSCAH